MLFSNFSKLPIICKLLKTKIPYKITMKIFQNLSKASTLSSFGTQCLFDLKTWMIQVPFFTCVFLNKFHHAIKKLAISSIWSLSDFLWKTCQYSTVELVPRITTVDTVTNTTMKTFSSNKVLSLFLNTNWSDNDTSSS